MLSPNYESALLEPQEQTEDPMQGGSDPYATALKSGSTAQDDPYASALASPGIGQTIVEGTKELGHSLVQFAKYLLEGPGIAFGESGWLQLNKPSILRDREAAAAGDLEAAKRVKRGEMGTALVASTIGASAASTALKVGQKAIPLTQRAIRFLSAEAIGGGIYGAIDPGDRPRTEAIIKDARDFAIAGGILNRVFAGAKGGFGFIGSKLLGRPAREKLTTATKEEAESIAKDAYGFMQKLGLADDAADAEIAHAQAVAVTQAVDNIALKAKPKTVELISDQEGISGIISRNTIPGEKPWRLTVFHTAEHDILPLGDMKYGSMEEALGKGLKDAAKDGVNLRVKAPSLSVSIKDIQPRISEPESLFPPVTPEHREALKEAFGSDYRIYETAYNKMRKTDDAESYAKFKGLLESFEDRLTVEQRQKLGAHGRPVWEVEMEQALKEGDNLAAADIAIEQAVNETPIKSIATAELQTDVDKLKIILETAKKNQAEFEAMPRTKVRKYESQLNETQQMVMQALAANDTERLATKLALDDRLRETTLADLLPAQIDRPRTPVAVTDAAVLYNRADDMTRQVLEKEGESIARKFLNDEMAGVSAQFAQRLGARAVLGAGSYAAGAAQDEDQSGFHNTSLKAVAGVLGLAAVLPGPHTKKLLLDFGLTRNVIKMFDLREVATKEGNEGMHIFHSTTGVSRAKAVLSANGLRALIKTPQENRAFTYVLDEGVTAPEYQLLSPEQQKEAISLRTARKMLGQVLESQGLVDDWLESYYRNTLPKETFDAWQTQYKTFKASGTPKQVEDFTKMRNILTWAKQHNLKEPIVNAAEANATHLLEAGALQAIAQTKRYFIDQGLLKPVASNGILTQGWRRMSGTSLHGLEAPDDVATVMERAYTHSFSIPYVDALRGMMMKSIMIFPWEHGVNLARGVAAIDVGSARYMELPGQKTIQAMKALDNADPVVMEVAKYTSLMKQPDLLNEASVKLAKNLRKAKLEFLAKGHEWGDRKLWENWAPAVQIVAWTTEMRKWGAKTGYKHLRGSPEYEAAARAAGMYADDAAGKIPDLVQDPKLAAAMRLALFSPAWLRTRMSILAHAAGDMQHILAGELNPKDAKYLQYKMKSVALGVAFTWLLSKAMSGEEPEFNPNTTKLYAKTPFYDDKGRQMGVDLVGWWQDDLKLFNDSWMFLENRLNPLLRVVNQTVTGRDVFGNELDGMERWENLIDQLGPPAVIPSAAIRAAKGEMTPAEGLRSGSEFLAVGNVSALPHYHDVAIAKMSEKILRMNGLSVHRDNIFELSKYIRQNIRMSGSWYGDNIQSFVAYRKRSQEHNFPITSLWRKGKEIIRDTFDK